MSEDSSIQVNFGKPMPLFPLDQVAVLPQQRVPIHIFEPRYRQMVEQALDGAGQIAMGVFRDDQWREDYAGNPAVRPAVCIAQIIQHEKLPDGRFNVWLQGVCRGRIIGEFPPEEGRLYRMVALEPVGLEGLVVVNESEEEEEEAEGAQEAGPEARPPESEKLETARAQAAAMLTEGPLTKFQVAPMLLEHLNDEEIPTAALLELLSFTIVADPELRYKLLAEPKAERRADMILHEMKHVSHLVAKAINQHPEEWPKGCSWN